MVKRLGPLTDLVRQGRWAERAQVPVGDLDGATMGIVGYGRIGRRVGELATAFGMRLLAYDPFSPPPAEIACPDLAGLASASDLLTLHIPMTEQTRHLIDEAFLDRTRPGTILVNCARGGLLDPDAPSKVEQVVDRFGVAGVYSVKELLSADVDGVIVAASTDALEQDTILTEEPKGEGPAADGASAEYLRTLLRRTG